MWVWGIAALAAGIWLGGRFKFARLVWADANDQRAKAARARKARWAAWRAVGLPLLLVVLVVALMTRAG